MAAVEKLDLHGTNITDDVAKSLADSPRLAFLNLEQTSVSDIALEQLSRSKSLETIIVRNTNVTAEGVSRLRDALPNCEVVSDLLTE